MIKYDMSRRRFLGLSGGTLVSSAMFGTMMGMERARAATADTSGYKALVCLYFVGGNDGFNTVVPLSTAGYGTYAATRADLALPSSTLHVLKGNASDGHAYGMHASCPEMQALFNSGNLAILGNVGTLVRPTTPAQAQAGSVPLPPQLFSHMDQTTLWQTSIANSPLRYGWAGRVADYYKAQGAAAKVAMNVNVGGANYLQSGVTTDAYVMGEGSAPVFNDVANTGYRGGLRSQTALAIEAMAKTDPNLFVQQFASIEGTAAAKVNLVNSALNSAGDLATPFPSYELDSNLGQQLHQVARTIKARSYIGDARQIFFVSMNGFDTHHGQLPAHATLLRTVSRNIGTFWAALGELGVQNDVTLFTASDFGRTLGSNGSGADHAWGNHHFILGGGVQGGKFYGTMPTLKIGGPDDLGQYRGQMVPTTSTDQYSATLAQWFGVPAGDLATVFPNLKNFAVPNLGFLG